MNPAILFRSCVRVLLCAVIAISLASFAQPAIGQDKVSFKDDIKPILEEHCIRCHGPEDEEGGFRVDDRDGVFNYVEPGDADFSDFYDYLITDDEESLMPPPNDGGPLPEATIALVKRWIDEGADWPEDVKVALVTEVVEQVKEKVAEEAKAKDASADNLQLATEITGLLHPVILHFPVALLIGGAFFALFGFRGESPMSDAAYYCLWLGAISAIFACLTGWYFAVEKNMVDWQSFDFQKSIDVHRWGGILIAVLSFLLALIACSSRRKDPYGAGVFWKLGMIVLAALTGFVAHHGGKMTHDGLHDKLFNKGTQLYENLTGEKRAAPEAEEESADSDDSAEDGPKTSDEGNEKSGDDQPSDDQPSDDQPSDDQPSDESQGDDSSGNETEGGDGKSTEGEDGASESAPTKNNDNKAEEIK